VLHRRARGAGRGSAAAILAAATRRVGGRGAGGIQPRGRFGVELLQQLDATADRWFTPAFIAAQPGAVDEILARFARVSPEGYAGCCAALAGADLRAELGRISVPVLAISGDDDPVCPPSDLQAIADGVADGRHLSLPGRHIVNIESAGAVNDALREFLGQ